MLPFNAIDLILVGFLFCSMFSNAIILKSLNSFRKHRTRIVELEATKHLCFILRVFEEENNIEETISYIQEAISGSPNISVIIVGVARERDPTGRNPTLSRAIRTTFNLKHFLVVEAPVKSQGTQGHQTNYALGFVGSDPSSTWIFTLDIDSKFSRAGMYAAIEAINNGKEVIQQHALFLTNFDKLGVLQRAHAMYQSSWTIRHETKRITLSNLTSMSVAHVVGHGLCINLGKLREYGNFPEETTFEDINLGFYLASSAEKIFSLPVFELGDNPPTFKAGFNQEYSWSYSAMLYPSYLAHFQRRLEAKYRLNRYRAWIITCMGAWGYGRWLIGSWFSAVLVFLALTGRWTAIACVLSAAFEYGQAVGYMLQSGAITKRTAIFSPLFLAIGVFRRSLPANLAFFDWVTTRRITKIKTPHLQ